MVARQLPAGRVTFVFTDIEGSTKLFHELGDDGFMRMLEDHNRIFRNAFDEHGGVEVKTEGDAFLTAFEDPAAAIASCLDAQLGLAAHDWDHGAPVKVRIGIHVGHAHVVEDDYVGLAVHEAARIAGAANGGQILLSERIAEETEHRLPAGAGLLDLGRHALKDFPDPQTLYQLTHPGLARDVPPPRTLTARDHNLPTPPNPLVGRREDLADVIDLLTGDARLVTLTGAGGLGKTRLAIEAGWQLLSWFRDGVWFVPLVTVSDPKRIGAAVARSLGIPDESGAETDELVVARLRDSTALLILDNFEQVLEGALLVSDLLSACPELRVLTTTRERLRLRGERALGLETLEVPQERAGADALVASAAGALLVERTRALNRRFTLDDRTAPDLALVCRQLSGVPLAIELAAPRVATLGPAAVAASLESALDVLTEGDRDLPRHQQTMRSAIAWSVDALDRTDRMALLLASTFVGSFTTDALRAVQGGMDEATETSAEASVTALVEASLLSRSGDVDADGSPRFWMLEPIRQFAAERLAAGGLAETAEAAHASWFLRVAEQHATKLTTGDQARSLSLLDRDRDNLRLAIARSSDDDAARLGAALVRFWSYRGLLREGRSTLEDVIERGGGDLGRRAVLHLGLGNLALADSDSVAAAGHLRAALEHATEAGDAETEALACNLLGRIAQQEGDESAATSLWRRGLDVASGVSRRVETLIRQELANAAFRRGARGEAEAQLRQVLEIQLELEDAIGAVDTRVSLAAASDPDDAGRLHREALHAARDAGHGEAERRSLFNLARFEFGGGRFESAAEYAEELIGASEAAGQRYHLALALTLRGNSALQSSSPDIDAVRDDLTHAVELFEELGLTNDAAATRELLEQLSAR